MRKFIIYWLQRLLADEPELTKCEGCSTICKDQAMYYAGEDARLCPKCFLISVGSNEVDRLSGRQSGVE